MNIFQSYTRRTQTSRLSKHDEYGLGLMHYAAIFNRPLIVSSLVLLTIDCNIKQQIDYVAHGPLPLHYAARCGSLDTLSCLISNFANITFTDHEGWAPIHHACYFDNVHAIKLFVRKQPELLEITTRSSSRKTPILIAALSGSLEAVKCCIELGANLSFHDEEGYNLIHLAAQK
jgi:ankyrin repeat protein